MPLWDFPKGTLYKREFGAYLLSQVLGWDFIPRTIVRDGPYGIGSVQEYVDHDPRLNYYTLGEGDAEDLRMICCFDLVSNNTDRKANHVLVDENGKLWGIDQGPHLPTPIPRFAPSSGTLVESPFQKFIWIP